MNAGRWMLFAACCALLAACSTAQPSPSPAAASAAAPTVAAVPSDTPSPTPTSVPEIEVPLAVVTGYTNPKASITMAEVEDAIGSEAIAVPCDVPDLDSPACQPAEEIVAHLQRNPGDLALLPAGLVDPTVKVLPVDGADLFGGPDARAAEYPLVFSVQAPPDEWLHDPTEIRTLMSLGDSCPDRGVAHAAITNGLGWDWVFGGGTAEYVAVYPNPVPPGVVGNGFNIVDAVPTGNEGAVAELVSGADVTLDDFECPVVDSFSVAVDDSVVFSIDPAVLPQLRDTYGVDVATLAANHLFDRGTAGFLETLEQFEVAGIATTGAGVDLEGALEPAFFDANGLTIGFVAFNEVPGSLEAAPGQPGVLWLRDANVREAVERARAEADVVICVPQWWGGGEYHAEFRGDMRRQQEVFFDAGCDHVLGHGTHWSGPIEIEPDGGGGHRVTLVSHGNFLFGQGWSQQTQEGVLLELSFRGAELAQARMHPYVMLDQAQTNLTNPETDGLQILNRIYVASGLTPD
ncbi:MAG: CapA family protein [Chloroflexota bacterium]